MLKIDSALEKNYFLDAEEENEFKIMNIFQEAQTTQLPVIQNHKISGILDLFSFAKQLNHKKKITEIMEKNIVVARRNDNISSYNNLQQKILPFVDEDELYIGFLKTNVIEKQLLKEKNSREIQYYKDLQEEFNAVIESSYDGIHILDGKGMSLRINRACERIEGINVKDVVGRHIQELVDAGVYSESVTLKVLEKRVPVTILQKVQNGKEVITTGTPIFKDGEIFRVVVNSRDITELNHLKKELGEVHQLAEKYQSELEHLRWEQLKTDDIVVRSHQMKKIVTLASHVAKVDSTVLIQGESGVGKGVLSKLIHRNSERKDGPFIKIDCSTIPQALLESELFGYEKGAFTNARREGKIGLIELANGGTLFLDEIGEMPLNLQVKLLGVLQDREIIRVGGKESIPVDIRIIAATNKDLKTMVEEKTFRQDLYYRLNVVPIFIPPLRERKEDIQPLIINYLEKFNKKYQLQKTIDLEVMEFLIEFNWPGNVRELENMIERLIVTTTTKTIQIENLPSTISRYEGGKENFLNLNHILSFKETIDDCEKKLLLRVMEKSKSTQDMANVLKLDRSTIRRKLKKHGIKIPY